MDYNISYRKKDKGIQCIISFKDENEKWRQKSKQGFKAQKDAKPWIDITIKELEEQIQLAGAIDPSLVGINFKELCEIYIKHKELYNVYSTIRNIKFTFKKFEKLNDMKVTDIKNLHIQECVDDMVREGLSVSSVTTYLSIVKTLFNYAIKPNKIIKDNPCDDITVPTSKKDDKVKALTKYQSNDLLSKIKRQDYYIVTLIASKCGLRLGEIMGLTWDRIDLKNKIITVNRQWKRLDNKKWGFGPVKQKNSNRVVPFSTNTKKALQRYKDNNPINFDNRIVKHTNLITLSSTLIRSYKSAGYDITVHELRHTYATNCIANGIDFKTTAKLLGHDVEMTIKTYSHVNDDMMKNATKTINKIF